MANTLLSPLPFTALTYTIAVGATAELDPAPWSNTKEVIFTNLSADDLLVQVMDVFGGVPGILLMAAAVVVPGTTTLHLLIGPEGYRNQLATNAFWVATPGANLNIVLGNNSANPVDVNVTFVQCPGGGGLVGQGF